MSSSVSGQDEPNLALWLATRAGKMELSCPLGIQASSRKENGALSHILNPLLTEIVRSRWLDIGLVLFYVFMDRDEVEVHKHAKKELGQYPAILTSRLVNNPYLLLWSRSVLR